MSAVESNAKKVFDAANQTPLGRSLESLEDAKNLVSQIPTLSTSKIVRYLGAGVYGAAFLLDNEHVIKITLATPGMDGPESEGIRFDDWDVRQLAAFKKLQDAQFDGTASLRDIAVYDYGQGTFVTEAYEDEETGEILKTPIDFMYVELAYVETLPEFLEKRKISIDKIDIAWEEIDVNYMGKTIDWGSIKRSIQRHRWQEAVILWAMVRTALRMRKATPNMRDFHVYNAGVLKRRGDKPTIVFFDF